MDLFKTMEDSDETRYLCKLVDFLEKVLSRAVKIDSKERYEEIYKDILYFAKGIDSYLPRVKEFNVKILKDLNKLPSDVNKLIESLISDYKECKDKEELDVSVVRYAVRIAELVKNQKLTEEEQKEITESIRKVRRGKCRKRCKIIAINI